MPADEFVFNGIDGDTGAPLLPPLAPERFAAVALGRAVPEDELRDLQARLHRDEGHLGVAANVEPTDLASAGWAAVFAYDADPAVRDALQPLLQHRRAQAARRTEKYYRECGGHLGYRPGDTRRAFLKRNGALPGHAADPENLPYYLLLVASPATTPFEFQYQLDVDYAVGRLWFETDDGRPDLAAFARYAESVVAAETVAPPPPRRAAVFAPQHDGDRATFLSATYLAEPLLRQLREPGWDCEPVLAAAATKDRLARLLGGAETPAVLFTAGHGLGFRKTSPRQPREQGALLCQDWPGRGGPAPPACYFAADDVGGDARLHGLIAFFFACYGAGTPAGNDFAHVDELRAYDYSTPQPVVARLPQRLLGHPKGGALAVLGHVDRALGCSFYDAAGLGAQVTTFKSTLLRILKGEPVGWAMEFFNQYHASVGNELGEELKKARRYGYEPDPVELSQLLSADNDARNFVVLGDPAVRLRSAEPGATAAP
jgi:hypothetical protein